MKRCSHHLYWWRDRIGEVFVAVIYRAERHDLVLEDGNCILVEDVEFVE